MKKLVEMIGMAKASSYSELKQVLSDARTEALVKASREARDHIKDVVIEQEVYGAGTPESYQRTYHLKYSIVDRPVEGGNQETATVKINHDTSLIDFNPAEYQHGNPMFGSATHSIPEIVHEGASGDMFGDGYWRNARPYMDVAERDLSGGMFRTFMVNELRGMGFTVR